MLGERIAKLRKEKKLSQYDLAERLGFSRGKLANYEQGSRQPDYDTLEKIADYFEVTTDYLLGRTDKRDGKFEDKKINKVDKTYNSLAEITKLAKKYGLEQLGFFDIEEWKNLGPEEIQLLDAQFKAIADMAKKRNANK
jgi:HTH-type transcriptional regulator, competence development regulator